jgi:hypothetical protein
MAVHAHLLCLGAVAMVAAGCVSPVPMDSGATGVAMQGPTCPVEQDPPDPDCADRPYVGLLAVADDGDVVVTFMTADDGAFDVALRPGRYHVTNAPEAPQLPSCSSEAFVVVAHAYTDVGVSCDTGIR